MFFFRFRSFFMMLSMLMVFMNASVSWSQENTKPSPIITPPPAAKGILNLKGDSIKKMEILNTTTKQTEGFNRVEDSFKNIQVGKTRAQEMVNMLRSDELTEAFSKITERTSRNITENPALFTPLAIIGGAAAFWYGKSMNVFNSEQFHLDARVEAQRRRSEFTMNSPLMNGKLDLNADQGVNMGFGRQISSLNANAYLNYNFRNQSINTEYRQKLSPHIDLTFGVGKNDQNTRIEYRFNF